MPKSQNCSGSRDDWCINHCAVSRYDEFTAPAGFLRQSDDLPRLPQLLVAWHENPVQNLNLPGMSGKATRSP